MHLKSSPGGAVAVRLSGRAARHVFFGIIVLLAITVYSGALNNDFVLDDHSIVLTNPYFQEWKHLRTVLTTSVTDYIYEENDYTAADREIAGFYRPTGGISFLIEHMFFGTDSTGYHAVNIFLHVCTGSVLYLLLLAWGRGGDAGGDGHPDTELIALLAAGLFLLHPLNSETVNWISARFDLLGTLFSLLTMLLFIGGCRVDTPRRAAVLFSLCGITFLLALGSKEFTYLLPLLISLMVIYKPARPAQQPQRMLPGLAMLWIILGAFLFLRYAILDIHVENFGDPVKGWYSMMRVLFYTYGKYLQLFIWPHPLSFAYGPSIPRSFFDPTTLAIAVVVIPLAWCWRSAPAYRSLLVTGLSLFLLMLAPVTNVIVPLYLVIAERYAYLPSVGLAVCAGVIMVCFIRRYPRTKNICLVVLTIVLGLFLGLIRIRTTAWQNGVTVMRAALETHPDSYLPHYVLGIFAERGGNIKLAREHFEHAAQMYPHRYYPRMALARLDMKEGQTAAARRKLEAMVAAGIEEGDVFYNLGVLMQRQGDLAGAIGLYRRVIDMLPGFLPAKQRLAFCLLETGVPAEAAAIYEEIIEAAPHEPTPWRNLGVIRHRQGRFHEALEIFKRYVMIKNAPEKDAVREMIGTLEGRLESRGGSEGPD